jgi:hypothetical protein
LEKMGRGWDIVRVYIFCSLVKGSINKISKFRISPLQDLLSINYVAHQYGNK